MQVAQLETTVKNQGKQLVNADVKQKSLTIQMNVEISNKESLQQTLQQKNLEIETLTSKVLSFPWLFKNKQKTTRKIKMIKISLESPKKLWRKKKLNLAICKRSSGSHFFFFLSGRKKPSRQSTTSSKLVFSLERQPQI